MELCKYCKLLDLKNLFTPGGKGDVERFYQSESFAELEKSSSSCRLCYLLYTEFLRHGYTKEIISNWEDGDSGLGLSALQYWNTWNGPRDSVYRILARSHDTKIHVTLGLYPDENDEIVVPESIVAAKRTKPADQQFELMKRWIEDCDENHLNCTGPPGRLPTRVVDVGLEGNQHPKTFQDAIATTRALGIRYLWIDSLCIVQGDPQDWDRESASMGEIYALSYLTIAASASRDSDGGLFLPRQDISQHVRVKCTLPSGQEGHVFIRPLELGFNGLPQSFLQSREWVVQERLLSPRTIHFDQDQILWECRSGRSTENGMSLLGKNRYEPVDLNGRYANSYAYKISNSCQSGFTAAWLAWCETVENCNKRHLTNEDDKLAAISGIASRVANQEGETYVAGLWERNLDYGLLWHTEEGRYVKRPQSWRAPSWSWASLEGPIKMSIANFDWSRTVLQDIQVNLEPLGSDTHGRLKSGSLTLTSKIKKIDPRMNAVTKQDRSETPWIWNKTIGEDLMKDNAENIGIMTFDVEFDANDACGNLWALQMNEIETNWPSDPVRRLIESHCLILEYSPKEDVYRRVGIGMTGRHLLRQKWFDDAEMKRICIL